MLIAALIFIAISQIVIITQNAMNARYARLMHNETQEKLNKLIDYADDNLEIGLQNGGWEIH